jgi:hypothetical protein
VVATALALLAASGCSVSVGDDDSITEKGVERSVEKEMTGGDPKLPGAFREVDCSETDGGQRAFQCQ